MTELALNKPRILPPKGLLIAILAQIPIFVSSERGEPGVIEMIAGALLIGIGALLNIWADRLFRRNNVGVCPFTQVSVLIESGPYRLTRNPMYLGLVCLNLGVTLFTGVLVNVWSSIAYLIWLHYAFVLPEEAFLRHRLNGAFEEYARRIPRWLFR